MSTARSFDVAVVGGGIVGLATARSLAERGLRVEVLEAEDRLAAHQTGHNSGVIHSGLYYRPGSLKARLCRAGGEALYRFCAEQGIPCRRTGKLVLATAEKEVPRLLELERRGRDNGLQGLALLDPAAIRERAPWAAGLAGMWVEETGIVDFPAVTEALARRLTAAGGHVRTGARLTAVAGDGDGLRLTTTVGKRGAGFLVTCAGLQADRVARLAGVDPGLAIVPFRGLYHEVRPRCAELLAGLRQFPVYPVPDPAFPFLGVHLTPTLDGRVTAGPNALLAPARRGDGRWVFNLRDAAAVLGRAGVWRFLVAHRRAAVGELARTLSRRCFARAVAALVPEIAARDLAVGGAGVRAQAMARDGSLVDDFHLVAGRRSLHVVNAPSPAATAALAIGDEVAARAVAAMAGG